MSTSPIVSLEHVTLERPATNMIDTRRDKCDSGGLVIWIAFHSKNLVAVDLLYHMQLLLAPIP